MKKDIVSGGKNTACNTSRRWAVDCIKTVEDQSIAEEF